MWSLSCALMKTDEKQAIMNWNEKEKRFQCTSTNAQTNTQTAISHCPRDNRIENKRMILLIANAIRLLKTGIKCEQMSIVLFCHLQLAFQRCVHNSTIAYLNLILTYEFHFMCFSLFIFFFSISFSISVSHHLCTVCRYLGCSMAYYSRRRSKSIHAEWYARLPFYS